MKKALFIFLRVIFVLITMMVMAFFGLKFYYQAQSTNAIEKSLVSDSLPIIGKKDAPFTIVEFFDYRCPHCPVLTKLVDEAVNNDPDIKIVLRPAILTDEESLKIALLVLAADSQRAGATVMLHQEIMGLSSIPSYETVKAIAESNGINIAQAEKDGEAFKPQIQKNTALVAEIGFYAVPSLVIGDKGFVPQERMPGINELRLMIIDAKQRMGMGMK